MLFAAEKNMRSWAVEGTKARWDYDTEDHLIEEMLNDKYFATCQALRQGDLVWVTDAAQESVVLRVDFVDPHGRRVVVSVLERQVFTPVTKQIVEDKFGKSSEIDDGYAVQWGGQRGGKWRVVKNGETVKQDFQSRNDAERELDLIRKQNENQTNESAPQVTQSLPQNSKKQQEVKQPPPQNKQQPARQSAQR